MDCSVDPIIDTWVYEVFQGQFVFIVMYHCSCSAHDSIAISKEHSEYRWVPLEEIEDTAIPDGYKQSLFKIVI
ncbi:hypothetical protein [Bacillus sp. 1P06AnD]|uniref:hypothetical protein n=1 Tax=Bacillus sp. 1P06AnD TaxID=3132208 RepID=UPI00399FD116